MEIEEIKKVAKETLSEKRFYHSMCVMEKCAELAEIYNVDIEMAKKVGIAHDIAKEMSTEEKFKYITDNKIEIDDVEKQVPGLLHAKIGADIAEKKFGFTKQMAQAIKVHTTAGANMDMLAKILYVADWTSKDRGSDYISDYMREMSNKDLDKAIAFSLNETINKKISDGELIHPNGILARDEFLQKVKGR